MAGVVLAAEGHPRASKGPSAIEDLRPPLAGGSGLCPHVVRECRQCSHQRQHEQPCVGQSLGCEYLRLIGGSDYLGLEEGHPQYEQRSFGSLVRFLWHSTSIKRELS